MIGNPSVELLRDGLSLSFRGINKREWTLFIGGIEQKISRKIERRPESRVLAAKEIIGAYASLVKAFGFEIRLEDARDEEGVILGHVTDVIKCKCQEDADYHDHLPQLYEIKYRLHGINPDTEETRFQNLFPSDIFYNRLGILCRVLEDGKAVPIQYGYRAIPYTGDPDEKVRKVIRMRLI